MPHTCGAAAAAVLRIVAVAWLATVLMAANAYGETPTLWNGRQEINWDGQNAASSVPPRMIIPSWQAGQVNRRRDQGPSTSASLPQADERWPDELLVDDDRNDGYGSGGYPFDGDESNRFRSDVQPLPTLNPSIMGWNRLPDRQMPHRLARSHVDRDADEEDGDEEDGDEEDGDEEDGDEEDKDASDDASDGGDKAASDRLFEVGCDPTAVHQGHVPYDPSLFMPDPDYSEFRYMPDVELGIYEGKLPVLVERPWIELGRGLYLPGRLPPSQTFFGDHNLVAQHLLVYGDYRMGAAYNSNGGRDAWFWAHRLNLDVDWKLTDTERIHAFIGPLDQGGDFTRLQYNNGDLEFVDAFDRNWDTIFFEGDVGSLIAGWRGHDSEFDLPFTVGLVPLLFQNGIWMEDAIVGAACTFPAKHSSRLDWSNFDVTFFVGFDELNSPAFGRDDSAANVYGVMNFIEAYGGYLEVGYAYLHDTTQSDLSYHNIGVSFTRRYRHRLSNSIRVIANTGQDPAAGPRTADGCVVFLENSLITSKPNTFVPYLNLFAGWGRPQSVARAGGSGGVLRNTGILFETDGLTGFPLLDDTANNAFGGALGVNLLGPNFDYQIVAEVATVQTFGRRAGRRLADDQYGVGLRYQLPITNAWLVRLDGMFGVTENDHNLTGARMELRYKF